MKNKIITSEGNVQFQFPDGKIVNVHPNHLYTVFNEDTVSFILIALPPSSGLAIMASKAEDLELDGQTYSIADLPNAVAEAFAEAGAQARCEIVDELPTTGKTNTIYLVPKEEGEGYDEYIYVNGEWELIGDTDIELDRYVDKETFSGYTADTLVLINTVSGDVITESERAISAETALQTAINEEASARTADVEALSGAVDNVQDEVDILSAALEEETSARTDADTALSNKIDGKVVELTQSEYDSLVDKDPLVLYVITDAVEVNMADYYKKTETSGATEIQTALASKQTTLTAGTGIDITDNVISATGGGGKSIVGGRGITVTTGETADTVSFNLPISAGTGTDSIIGCSIYNTASKSNSVALGSFNKASGDSSMAVNDYNVAGGKWSFAGGNGTKALGDASTSFGYNTNANKDDSFAVGRHNNANNVASFACGVSNISSSASTTFGHSGNTLFSVGNGGQGYYSRNRHNAFEIRENGDIYIADTNDTETTHEYEKPMIKLQDAIGGGGTSYSAGTGIDITNDVISVTGKVDTSDFNTYSGAVESRLVEDEEVTASGLNALNDKFGGLKLMKITQSAYDALTVKDNNTLYIISD